MALRFGSDPLTVTRDWPYAMWQRAVARIDAETEIAGEKRRKADHEARVRDALGGEWE